MEEIGYVAPEGFVPGPLNPFDVDSDDDGLTDFDEVNYLAPEGYAAGPLDPLDDDSDSDGLLDGEEVNYLAAEDFVEGPSIHWMTTATTTDSPTAKRSATNTSMAKNSQPSKAQTPTPLMETPTTTDSPTATKSTTKPRSGLSTARSNRSMTTATTTDSPTAKRSATNTSMAKNS